MDELLTVWQVSERLKVSKMTIYRYIKAGKLVAIKAGRDFRIRKSDFHKFLERSTNK
jgi:excisionase family DNA binding protein